MKKKLEGDAADLGLALEHAIAGNAKTQTTIKRYALQVRDAQLKVDDESAAKSAAADAKVNADRKAAAMQNALEEARALLETADRQCRAAEYELADINETLADQNNVNQSIAAAKRKLDAELGQLNADLDEMTNEAGLSEDKAASAMVDAARLADELRGEENLTFQDTYTDDGGGEENLIFQDTNNGGGSDAGIFNCPVEGHLQVPVPHCHP